MDENDGYDDAGYFGSNLREWRHNPCLMQPTSLVMFLVFGVFMLITLLVQVPTLVLGLVLAPILSRSSWYVEFLYPWDIARWAHFFLIKSSTKQKREDDKNRGFHSRATETRIEVIPGRIYIHPIPQWLDNLGWLIVCLPAPKIETSWNARITVEDKTESIIGLMIDCGEAPATFRAIELIQQYHYGREPIQLQAIVSTHKHHDHTGGNKELLAHPTMGSSISKLYAGAVERVPQCTNPLVNGDKIDLPKSGTNDMNELVEMEAIAVPAHTRGSMVYRLFSKQSQQDCEFMFTGDTMFSAGGGVPFEADVGTETDSQLNKTNGNTFFRAGIGQFAMERCFAEILSRGMPEAGPHADTSKILTFPGHEYTQELLSRQLQTSTSEACRWRNFAPRDFFDTVSHMYVALHRRALPHNSGKLLVAPSMLSREVHISPQFRSLRRAGELVIRAVSFWHNSFCKNKIATPTYDSNPKKTDKQRNNKHGADSEKTPSTLKKWTLAPTQIQEDVFTTMYKTDIDTLIEDLSSGAVSKQEAARKLREAGDRLNEPVVNKRAIPGFKPSDKGIYKGISGLVLLGSPPAAMTRSDSKSMNLPSPLDSNSDHILISMRRLTLVMGRLGLFEASENIIAEMIRKLWSEASEYVEPRSEGRNGDLESTMEDSISLGVLKWVIYGVPSNQPSFFSKLFCMPCSKVPTPRTFPDHPASKMKQRSGDLVSHDVLTCLLCRNATGCLEIKGSKQILRTEPPELAFRETESDVDDEGEEAGLEVMEGIASSLLPKEHE